LEPRPCRDAARSRQTVASSRSIPCSVFIRIHKVIDLFEKPHLMTIVKVQEVVDLSAWTNINSRSLI
jgi:hypothetical protein